MSFWANVDSELKYQGISRKELSYQINAKEITIHKAIERDSVPNAETALKIAKALNVSLEYLLDMQETKIASKSKENVDLQKATKMYKKYNSLLTQFESLNKKERFAVAQLITTLGNEKNTLL